MGNMGYFSGLFDSLNSKNNSMNSLYSSLGDYNTIQKGTYKKLLNSYYNAKSTKDTSKADTASKKNKISTDKTEYSDTSKYATELSEAAQKLSSTKNAELYKEGNETELVTRVNNFAKSYNKTYNDAIGSKSSSVKNIASGMNTNTKAYEKDLKKIGISINEDNELTVDADILKSADKTTVKRLLGSGSSFGGSTMRLAAQIGSSATAAASGVTTYDANGTFSSTSVSGYYDLFS